MSAHTLFRNDKSIGLIVSFLFHAALLALGGFLFVQPVQYTVELGSGGIEVSLTAAPVEQASILQPVPEQEQKLVEEELPEDSEEVVQIPSEHKGDGSSVVPGKDAATFYSAGGAIVEAKPKYLRNPAPPYPWEARQNGWQGIVVLKVFVDKSGHPVKIEKEQTSGHAVLDDSALRTVKSWRFHPAQLGNLPVESTVRIPIRFELQSGPGEAN